MRSKFSLLILLIAALILPLNLAGCNALQGSQNTPWLGHEGWDS